MNLAFSGVLYLVAGFVAIAWLVAERRISESWVVRVVAVMFWPAYLPACLAHEGRSAVADKGEVLESLRRQIDRLVTDPARRAVYQGSVDRLRDAMAERRREIDRLLGAEARLQKMRRGLGTSELALVDARLYEVGEAKARAEGEMGRAREALLRLVLRVEVIATEDSKGGLERELLGLEDELGRLLDAQKEAEALLKM